MVVKILTGIGAVLLALVALMVYMNVISDDREVLAQAEKLAREKTKCGEGCTRTRVEGTSRVIDKKYAFTFEKGVSIKIVCRRAYIAFGSFDCSEQ